MLRLFLIVISVYLPVQAQCPKVGNPLDIGYNQHPMLQEISGIVASKRYLNIFWVHNDSGDDAQFYAMDIAGKHRGTFILPGREHYDYEDIAMGPGPDGKSYLYLGDIGDNKAKRASIQVLRIIEPAPLEADQATALSGSEVFTFTFEDGSRDAECLFVDPCTGDLYVISKRESQSRLYMAEAPFTDGGTYELEFKVEMPWGWTTAADISPDGSMIVVRSYRQGSLWRVPQDKPLWQTFLGPECPINLQDEPQGEAISFDHSGCCILSISEYSDEWLYHYQIDQEPSHSHGLGVVE